jgi:peptidoglycan/LPS O-acetylase OafA/YrhL
MPLPSPHERVHKDGRLGPLYKKPPARLLSPWGGCSNYLSMACKASLAKGSGGLIRLGYCFLRISGEVSGLRVFKGINSMEHFRPQPKSEMSEPAETRHYMPCLDGVRGLAALIVLIGHGPSFGFAQITQPLSRDYGVLIFFVLSGFLMGDIYLRQKPTRPKILEYACSRAARIAPLYFFVVIVSFAVFQLIDPEFTYPITLVQLLRLLTFNGSVSVFWSIGPEVQFYGLFILLWLIHSKSRLAFFIFTICVSAICLLTIKKWPGVLVFSKLHIFACGVLLASIRRQIRLTQGTILLAQFASILVLTAVLFIPSFSDLLGNMDINDKTLSAFYDSLPRTLVAGLIVFSFSYETTAGRLIFANPGMVICGSISFSIYLLHGALMYLFVKAGLLHLLGQAAGTALLIATVLLVSWMSFTIIEMPARRFIKRQLLIEREKPRRFESR